MAVSTAEPIFAGSSSATNGKSSQIQLNFKIVILPSLALQVKTATADNMLASLPVIGLSDAGLLNTMDKKIYVTASANIHKHGRLNVSSNFVSAGNWPTTQKRTGQDLFKSFPLPYIPNGHYRLVLSPIDPGTILSPNLPPTFTLCSP